MHAHILPSVEEAIDAISFLRAPESLEFIERASGAIANCLAEGNKLLIAGNGGSLCDAMHFAEELTGQFREKRPGLAAIALSDPGFLTCTGNDYGFEEVFARGIDSLGCPGDLFVGLSTSGNSANVIRAFARAKQRSLKTMAFLGKNGGKLKGVADLEWIVPHKGYSDRIQEVHMAGIHIIIEMVEKKLFTSRAPLSSMTVSTHP